MNTISKHPTETFRLVTSLLFFLFFALPGLALAAEDAAKAENKYSYYYEGKLVTLEPSNRYLALRDVGDETQAFEKRQKLRKDPLSNRPELKQNGFNIYLLPDGAQRSLKPAEVQSQLQSFASSGVEVQPVFEQGQALLIPSNKLIVDFKQYTPPEKAKQYFAKFTQDKGITEVKNLRKNSYLLTIDNPANGRVYQLSQFFSSQGEIEFAEPDHVIIMLDPASLNQPEIRANRTEDTEGVGMTTHNSPVTWTTLINESCEGATLPAGWTTGRLNNTFTDANWNTTNVRSHLGARSCYATGGGSAGVAAPGSYPNNTNSWLDTPLLNLATFEEVYIEFWFYAKYFHPNWAFQDYGQVSIFDTVSNTTTELCRSWYPCLIAPHTGDLTNDVTTDSGWRRILLRVPPALRLNGVKVRITFGSDASDASEGLYVDQIRIVATNDVDTEPLGNDTYGARLYEYKNAGQIAGLGHDGNDMNVAEAWDLVSVSSDVVVAVIDSGVDLTHPDLNMVTSYNSDGTVGGGPFGSHGTAVAGNVGAIRNNFIGVMGSAPGVKIMSVQLGFTNAQIASSIDVAVANGANILTNSWGWVGVPSGLITSSINDALAANRVVLFAAGNGPDRPPFTYDIAYPGNLCATTDVICVGASSPTDEHKATASSDGSHRWGSSYVGVGPDVVAPSPWSYSTDIQGAGGYNDGSLINPSDPSSADYTPSFGGTSSSTPKTAGVAALLLSAKLDLTPGEVKQILRDTAKDIDAPGIDDKTGAGRVDAYKAVKKVLLGPPWYIGLAFGFTNTEISSIDALAPGGLDTDDSDTAFKLFGGRKFSRNYAVEFGYINLGDYSQESPGVNKVKFDAQALFAELVGWMNVDTNYYLFGKLGIAYWDVDLDYTDFSVSSSNSDTGLDPVVGLGFEYRIPGDEWSVRIEWEQYQNVGEGVKTTQVPATTDIELNGQDINVFSLGATYHFDL